MLILCQEFSSYFTELKTLFSFRCLDHFVDKDNDVSDSFTDSTESSVTDSFNGTKATYSQDKMQTMSSMFNHCNIVAFFLQCFFGIHLFHLTFAAGDHISGLYLRT